MSPGCLKNYDFITKETLAYFDKRLTQAPRDADFALDYVKRHATTPELQRAAMDRPDLQVHRALDAARCAVFRLCRPRHDPAGCVAAGRGTGARGQPRCGADGRACGLLGSDVPRLPRGVRLRFDEVRNKHVLLAPERTFDLDDNAVAVLKLVDGQSSVSQIARTLGQTYDADPAVIEADILVMLAGLAQRRVLER